MVSRETLKRWDGWRLVVAVVVVLFVVAAVPAILVLLMSTALNWPTPNNLQRPLTIANPTDLEFIANYQQSQDNTWHTTMTSKQPLSPGATIQLSYQTGDRIVLWPPEDAPDRSYITIFVLDDESALVVVAKSTGDGFMLVERSQGGE